MTIKIFDVLGRELETLKNENLESGEYKINYQADELSSGLYFLILQINGYSTQKKIRTYSHTFE